VVRSFTKREKEEPVYNIEVDGDHCYRVGEFGLLVHNSSAGQPNPYEEYVRSVLNGRDENLPYNDAGDLQEIDVSTRQFLGQAKEIDPCSLDQWPADRPPQGLVDQLRRYKAAADRLGRQVRLILPFSLPPERRQQLLQEIPGLVFQVIPFPRTAT
jgi:hypothetical protein